MDPKLSIKVTMRLMTQRKKTKLIAMIRRMAGQRLRSIYMATMIGNTSTEKQPMPGVFLSERARKVPRLTTRD